MANLSVIIITYNEEVNISRCLQSVQWADEIIVVDSYSTDKTVERAKLFTPHVFQHPFDGDIPQRQRGFQKAGSDWLLYIDADEEVSPELKDEIQNVLNSDNSLDGYYVPRKVRAFGRWIIHGGWFPDYSFRLFRREKAQVEHAEVHGGFTIHGDKGRLNGFLYHYTYDSIEQYLTKMNDYTSLQVSNKLRENPGVSVSWTKILLSPLSHFLRTFLVKKGWKDGIPGFVLSVLGALYTLSLYSKLWEYQIRTRERSPILPPITNLEIQQLKRMGGN